MKITISRVRDKILIQAMVSGYNVRALLITAAASWAYGFIPQLPPRSLATEEAAMTAVDGKVVCTIPDEYLPDEIQQLINADEGAMVGEVLKNIAKGMLMTSSYRSSVTPMPSQPMMGYVGTIPQTITTPVKKPKKSAVKKKGDKQTTSVEPKTTTENPQTRIEQQIAERTALEPVKVEPNESTTDNTEKTEEEKEAARIRREQVAKIVGDTTEVERKLKQKEETMGSADLPHLGEQTDDIYSLAEMFNY